MPTSPVPGTYFVSDPIALSDSKFYALNAPVPNGLNRTAVNVQVMAFGHFCYEYVWLSVEQNADPIFVLRDLQSSQVKSLAESVRVFPFDYHNRMIAVTWSAKDIPSDSTLEDEVAEDNEQWVVKRRAQDGFTERASLL